MPYQLPDLPYDYGELERSIDAQTMELHHSKHHNTYVTKLNDAIGGTEHEETPLEQLFPKISQLPVALRNNGGGHWNHALFWQVMSPDGGGKPEGTLAEAIDQAFGSFEQLREQFTQAAIARFGSGWAWLIKTERGLEITDTPNQDNPLMDVAARRGTPLLTLDVWEHAYYLRYQNRRPDYIEAWWDVVNWPEVARRFAAAE
ncbi:superoxide dismutase [Halorhodospira abdelmalekii]|uniref:superoxide dismutase n=1 Tax=Halorhodospira abdelmalekii TaxID=421629 RepID=UPI0019051205|nr:superoxide dismutase [Halorhodospira abdelmalekii]MBK1734683.1 superoxide dismutase [Halorhodospira abdelmalekii]